MAYVSGNPKTKKACKEMIAMAIADGKGGLIVYQPGLGTVPENGSISLEGPHFPKPHTWYGQGKMENGKLVSVK